MFPGEVSLAGIVAERTVRGLGAKSPALCSGGGSFAPCAGPPNWAASSCRAPCPKQLFLGDATLAGTVAKRAGRGLGASSPVTMRWQGVTCALRWSSPSVNHFESARNCMQINTDKTKIMAFFETPALLRARGGQHQPGPTMPPFRKHWDHQCGTDWRGTGGRLAEGAAKDTGYVRATVFPARVASSKHVSPLATV